MAVLYSDTFTRADSSTSPGTPDVGGPYTVRTGTFGISSNQLTAIGGLGNAHLTFPAATNIDLSATVTVPDGTNPGLVFRWVDVNNYWFWSATGVLTARIAGSNNGGGTVTRAANAGDVLRVVAFNETITCLINGKVMVELNDVRYKAGVATAVAGLMLSGSAGKFDNATCSDATTVYGDLAGAAASIPSTAMTQTAVTRNGGANLYKGRSTATADSGSVA